MHAGSAGATRVADSPGIEFVYYQAILHENRNMTTQVNATVVNGMLKPDELLTLADETRVRLTIEPLEEWSPAKAPAAWEAIQEQLKEHPPHFGGQRYTRDEMHERR